MPYVVCLLLLPGLAYPYLQPLLRRAASDDLSEYRRQSHRAHAAHTLSRHHTTTHRNSAQRAAAVAAGQSLLMRKSAASNIAQQGLQQVVVQQQQHGEGGYMPDGSGGSGQQYHSNDYRTAAGGAWWPDIEHQPSAAGYAGSIPSSIHTISRPASPSPIPSAKMSSYVDELPDFGDLLAERRQQQRHVATSAPVTTTASLLGGLSGRCLIVFEGHGLRYT